MTRLHRWWDEFRALGSGVLIVVLFTVGSVWPFLVFGTDVEGAVAEVVWLVVALIVVSVVAVFRWGDD